jgi:hypothetical protein
MALLRSATVRALRSTTTLISSRMTSRTDLRLIVSMLFAGKINFRIALNFDDLDERVPLADG